MSANRFRPASWRAAFGAIALLLSVLFYAPGVEAVSPTVTATEPMDGEITTGLTTPIQVWFSVAMDNTTVTWTITPWLQLTPDWSPDNTSLTLNHSVPFVAMTVYTVEVKGNDTDGHPLVAGPVPNPWQFSTTCAPCSIVSTDPADGETNVPLDKDVTVVFDKPPDAATLTWTVTPSVAFTPAWSSPTTLVLSHTSPFLECTWYTISIWVIDLLPGPVPNPWSFRTQCPSPFIVSTDPADGDVNVPLDKDVTVVFSSPPNPATLMWTVTPAIAFTDYWPNLTTLVLSHMTPFTECTVYTVGISWPDPVIPGPVPNPWSFTTGSTRPCLVRTDPADGARDVTPSMIIAWFSAPVDHIRIPVRLNISPDPGPYSSAWSIPATVLTTSLMRALPSCTMFTVVVSDDVGPVPGTVPNPWSFRTPCPGPFITATDPANGSLDVPLDAAIAVMFSEPMSPATVTWTITPAVQVTPSWPTASSLQLTPDAPLAECTKYTVQIDATGLYAGALPNPWSFTTWCSPLFVPSAPRNLVATPGNARVVLTWLPPADDGGSAVTEYHVYRGTAPGAETLRTGVGLNLSYTDVGVVNGGTYYYQVAAVNAVGVGLRAPEVNATPRNLPPICVILSPTSGTSFSGILIVTGTAFDTDGSVERVEVRIDSGLWRVASGNASWILVWDTTALPNGGHTIEARAYDGTTYSAVTSVDIVVNNPPPSNPIAIPTLVWLALILVPAIAIPIVVFVLLRRRRPAEEEGHPR